MNNIYKFKSYWFGKNFETINNMFVEIIDSLGTTESISDGLKLAYRCSNLIGRICNYQTKMFDNQDAFYSREQINIINNTLNLYLEFLKQYTEEY